MNKNVTLEPGQSEVVAFEVVPHTVGTYLVNVNGLTGSFEAIESGGVDYLSLSQEDLWVYLTNGSVANDWWGMTYEYRRALGLKIINWWSVDFISYPYARARGGANCGQVPQFSPYEHPELCILLTGGMEHESGLRYCLFTDNSLAPRDLYWFKKENDTWYCYDLGGCFHLPTAVAVNDPDYLNALQVGEDVNRLDSWIFFQTWLDDGFPGCDQRLWPDLRHEVSIWVVKGISKNGATELGAGEKITTIHY